MLARLGYPQNELVIERTITGWEGVCVVSRILTTKILSALLVAVMWLQRTWCPRFRRSTFGYGTTISPNIREISMSKEVSMRMHVSSTKVPKCMCDQMHTQKVTFILIQKVVSKTHHDWHEIPGRVLYSWQNSDLIPTSITTPFMKITDEDVQSRHYTAERSLDHQQLLELQCRLAAPKEATSSANHIN
jgi:hypothetical protein